MDEYVKREKVHEVVSRLQKYVWKNPVEHGPMGQIKYRITVGADDVDFEVDKIPAEDVVPVSQWIPVGERMPEVGKAVLVIASGWPKPKTELRGAVEIATLYTDKTQPDWVLEAWLDWENPEVTHWMPLPEAPEVEK